ncbi:hypothetical protein F4775DRAFT_580644 [Biscogniauxia sp. FL1348]|nr:hypothetical protein F4775DRAFT_580644 [Biscogniauxia sp. FL1348]
MAASMQNNESAGAVQYFNQDNSAPEVQRPVVDVPIDTGYALQRFLNPQGHAEDRILRPLQPFRTPLTEDQARERMNAIILAASAASAALIVAGDVASSRN